MDWSSHKHNKYIWKGYRIIQMSITRVIKYLELKVETFVMKFPFRDQGRQLLDAGLR